MLTEVTCVVGARLGRRGDGRHLQAHIAKIWGQGTRVELTGLGIPLRVEKMHRLRHQWQMLLRLKRIRESGMGTWGITSKYDV